MSLRASVKGGWSDLDPFSFNNLLKSCQDILNFLDKNTSENLGIHQEYLPIIENIEKDYNTFNIENRFGDKNEDLDKLYLRLATEYINLINKIFIIYNSNENCIDTFFTKFTPYTLFSKIIKFQSNFYNDINIAFIKRLLKDDKFIGYVYDKIYDESNKNIFKTLIDRAKKDIKPSEELNEILMNFSKKFKTKMEDLDYDIDREELKSQYKAYLNYILN